MRKYVLLLTALAISALLLFGCGGANDSTVAVVDGEDIPVAIIHDFFDKGGWTFESYAEEFKAKRAAVDSVIDYKLLVKGAYESGLANDQEIEKLIVTQKANFLFDVLYKMDVAPATNATDADIREFYDKLKQERRIFHILVATKPEADSIRQQLSSGAAFDSIARLVSLDQSSAVRGGELGWLNWGTDVVAEFREKAFQMAVGETSEPLKTEFGYHIIRFAEAREVELRPFAELQPFIKTALVSRRAMESEEVFLRKMEEKAAVQINPEATAMLLERLEMYYPPTLNNATRPDNFFPNLELLKPFEQQMIIASYTGGELTVESYINKLADVPDASRPRFDDERTMKKVIFQLELRNIVEYEAEQRKIQDTDEDQKRVTDFREGLMVDKFTRQVIGQAVSASEDEISEYYNSHITEFTVPQEYHVFEIQMATAELLAPVIEELRGGANFEALAARNTIRVGMKATKGDLGFVQKSRYPKIWEAASKLPVDKISDIVVNDEGTFSVIKVVDVKQPVIRPIEGVVSQVQARIIDLKRSSATVDWLRDRREKAKIEINEDALVNSIDKAKYDVKG
ncbi:MAG: peptidylprolyl isomerase [bacterium]|nr:peptidylprolyl isomerase [bacterium]